MFLIVTWKVLHILRVPLAGVLRIFILRILSLKWKQCRYLIYMSSLKRLFLSLKTCRNLKLIYKTSLVIGSVLLCLHYFMQSYYDIYLILTIILRYFNFSLFYWLDITSIIDFPESLGLFINANSRTKYFSIKSSASTE